MFKHARNILVAASLAVMMAGPAAWADYYRPGPLKQVEFTVLEDQPLTSSVTTLWYNVGGYSQFTMEVIFIDANSSITRLDWYCESSDDDAPNTTLTNAYRIKTMYVTTTGVIQYTTGYPRMAVAGSEKFPINMGINYKWVRCSFSVGAGSAAAADTLTITGRVLAD
jgi:hypothetical protein